MAMEELDKFEVLWPDTCHAHAAQEAPPAKPSESLSTPRLKVQRCPARSRPVDVPNPKAARSQRWNGRHGDGDEEEESSKDIVVPPHLLVSGRRRPEAVTAWTLRTPGPPCKRARDLRHLRNSVLRMTGFIEG